MYTNLKKIEEELRMHDAYIISSVDGNGAHVGKFKGISYDSDGNLVIETDINSRSCTCSTCTN